jgi:hypothetical protein
MPAVRRVAPLAVLLLAGLALAGAAGAARDRPQALTTSSAAQWNTWWGSAAFGAGGVTLSSTVPTSAGETHSALVTSKRTWRDQTISLRTTTLSQLRAGTPPNPWEVGWVMFRFRDLANYYYFIVKTNGVELGKKQGSDAQIFLATGDLPRLDLDRARAITVRAQGARIRVSVDGTQVIDYTDPHPLLAPGSVGLYEEDSQVRFDSLATN